MGDSPEHGVQGVDPTNGARLEAVSGPLKGKRFPLTGDEVSIGRDPSNDISLLDSLVSRRHCVIRKDANAFRLLDLDSRNNTFISGVPVRERLLVQGDQIRVMFLPRFRLPLSNVRPDHAPHSRRTRLRIAPAELRKN